MCNSVISTTTRCHRLQLLVLVVLLAVVVVPTTSSANRKVYLGSVGSNPLGTEIETSLYYGNPHTEQSVIECDLLVSYPADLIVFIEAIPTPLDAGCNWAYFDVTQPADSLLRISARAESGTGNCLNSDSVILATIRFQVTNDASKECQGGLFNFVWQDCLDNTFVPEDGSSVLASDTHYGDPHTYPFPPTGRGATDSCVADIDGVRAVNFYVGAVAVDCVNSIDNRGDVNVNGIAYEIADFVMFQNYFVFGPSAFGDHQGLSIAATDVNSDGVLLTLRDLIYLHDVIVGDTLPLPRVLAPDTAWLTQDMSAQTLSIDYAPGLAALWVKFDGDIGAAPLFNTSSGMYLAHHFDGSFTRVLVMQSFSDSEHLTIPSGPVISYTGTGNLVEYDLTDWSSMLIPSMLVNTGGSCCVGVTGNVDCSTNDVIDIGDLTRLIDYLLVSYAPLCCPNETNTDGEGTVDIGDLTALINYLFTAPYTPPVACP